LPNDLQRRLATEPGRSQSPWKGQVFVLASGLAAGVVVFLGVMVVFWPKKDTAADTVVMATGEAASQVPEQPVAPGGNLPSPARPLSVIKKDSALLNSRVLAIKEYEGQFWEICEEEWRDETLVLYSAGPSKLHSTVIRREVVCSPLTFQ
jgi:hypothetical protein